MTKLQILLRAPASRPGAAFRDEVLDVATRLPASGRQALKVTLTDRDAPRLSVVPYRRDRLAVISVWDEAPVAAARDRWLRAVADRGGTVAAAYHVDEALPAVFASDVAPGAPTPGLGQLTLLRRRRGLSDAELRRRWFDGHTPLAMRLHPIRGYVRGQVLAPLTDGAPDLDGIVELWFHPEADLLRPVRFFGGALRLIPNAIRLALDVQGFIDLRTIETYLVSEVWLRRGRS
jgi:hypothetical protein